MRTIAVASNTLRVSSSPDILKTKGIGSCVAIALFDARKRIGGLAHISLPAKTDNVPEQNLHKYAEIAIETLLENMQQRGTRRGSIVAKIVGGGNMFAFAPNPRDDIGRLNVEAVRNILHQNQVVIVSEDVFGKVGKSVAFDLSDGCVRVTEAGRKEG